MKKIIYLLVLIIVIVNADATGQIIRPFTSRYNNPSVKGNIVYVANSIITSAGIGAGSPGTGEVPPGGSTKNGPAGVDIDIDNVVNVTKIAFGSVWNYHAQNAAPANSPAAQDWKQSAYVLPGTWNVGGNPVAGAGKYGYNATQTTCLPSGQVPICTPAAGNKFTAYYFRQSVSFTALELSATYHTVQLNVKRDDGIVIYVNGVEVARDNMPAGVPAYGSLASANIAPGAAENVTFNINTSSFIAGVNTIAVEVHTNAVASTDMSFDMEVRGLGNHNSSSADLNLSSCSTVLFAGLYWGAGEGSNSGNTSWITGETKCLFKAPGAGSYTQITSSQNDYWNSTLIPAYAHTGYNSFKDITSLINTTNPNGTYTIADVVSPLGKTDAYGGWTIVIVYANPSLAPRNLSVFDGNAAVKSGSGNVDVPITGFLTPPAGAVSCELGTVVYDGDRGSTDGFQFKQNGAAVFYDMATTTIPLNGTADAWNSKISTKGVVNAARNPAFQNTLGYDASIFDLPNAANAQLSNIQNAATVRFFSNSENVIVNVLTTAISQYTPTFAFDKTATDINGGALVPGDSIRYQINYSNVGNDASINSVILDNIPAGTSFLPGSIKINGVAKTDVSSDDQAEYDLTNNRVAFRLGTGATSGAGGIVATGSSGNVQFNVVVSSSCSVLACVGPIKNSARIDYKGQTSGSALSDSSGVNSAGCITQGPVISTVVGGCYTPSDTLLTNICPATSLLIPFRKYGGYTIYSAQPFIPANVYNPTTPVTVSHVYWAYFNNGPGCSDTVKISVFIMACPDIDDDNDGIPDYVEINNPLALQDANSNGIPNWNDASYPGFVDNNADGVNDNFDPSADSDNDGIPNFYDTNFPGYVDTNGDGVNDTMDKDLDGIPNHLDLDSDNDGIPDVVESYGVDANGDGVIDNYSTSDLDGFSQNVDGSSTGVVGSGNGLGAQDLDGDGIPNYLDLDSDNDGIPDVIEAGGTDADYNGKIDGFIDTDADGFSDQIDGDVGNDGTAENSANTLLRTGADTNGDGRADSYPYRNLDYFGRPNPYDLDSDGDGITDVIEAGFPDTNYDGIVDGARSADGWNTALHGVALNLLNTDGRGNPDYLDIDADDDGIPDNIEGQTTASYKFPSGIDADKDGIDDTYDISVGFGGSGIFLSDKDVDGIPDYRDLDTDSDGQPDIYEGNDFNLNGIADDDVTLTFLDTDGDGLDNRFDSLNSTINVEGTSYMMGTGGSLFGDATPGARCPVQKTISTQTDRDWRYTSYVLGVKLLNLAALSNNESAALTWNIISALPVDRFELQRSVDNINFIRIETQQKEVPLNTLSTFNTADAIASLTNPFIFYRLKVINKNGQVAYSNVVIIKKTIFKPVAVSLHPNPASDYVTINFTSDKDYEATISLSDNLGKVVMVQKQRVSKGNNSLVLNSLSRFSSATYILQIVMNDQVITQKLIIQNK